MKLSSYSLITANDVNASTEAVILHNGLNARINLADVGGGSASDLQLFGFIRESYTDGLWMPPNESDAQGYGKTFYAGEAMYGTPVTSTFEVVLSQDLQTNFNVIFGDPNAFIDGDKDVIIVEQSNDAGFVGDPFAIYVDQPVLNADQTGSFPLVVDVNNRYIGFSIFLGETSYPSDAVVGFMQDFQRLNLAFYHLEGTNKIFLETYERDLNA